jgi:hypothetical protein
MIMSIFGNAGESKGGDVGTAGPNGNVRDARAKEGRHVAVDDSPHTNATRRSDHEPQHAAK